MQQFSPTKGEAFWFQGVGYETEEQAMEACREAFIANCAKMLDCGEEGEGLKVGVERVLRLLMDDAPDQFDAAMAAIDKARNERQRAAESRRMSQI